MHVTSPVTKTTEVIFFDIIILLGWMIMSEIVRITITSFDDLSRLSDIKLRLKDSFDTYSTMLRWADETKIN